VHGWVFVYCVYTWSSDREPECGWRKCSISFYYRRREGYPQVSCVSQCGGRHLLTPPTHTCTFFFFLPPLLVFWEMQEIRVVIPFISFCAHRPVSIHTWYSIMLPMNTIYYSPSLTSSHLSLPFFSLFFLYCFFLKNASVRFLTQALPSLSSLSLNRVVCVWVHEDTHTFTHWLLSLYIDRHSYSSTFSLPPKKKRKEKSIHIYIHYIHLYTSYASR